MRVTDHALVSWISAGGDGPGNDVYHTLATGTMSPRPSSKYRKNSDGAAFMRHVPSSHVTLGPASLQHRTLKGLSHPGPQQSVNENRRPPGCRLARQNLPNLENLSIELRAHLYFLT